VIRKIATGTAALVGFWVVGFVVALFHPPTWLNWLLSLAGAAAAGWFLWTRYASAAGLVKAMAIGAFILGVVGFCAGFFGPLIFKPDANQGPLLGIFITGPLGFVLGAIGGGVWWFMRRKRGAQPVIQRGV